MRWNLIWLISFFGVVETQAQKSDFKNSLGMLFVTVPNTEVYFSVYETSVKDYQVFVKETKRTVKKPSFKQNGNHAAVNVSWEDAKAFCYWLTAKERKEKIISAKQYYRLPNDKEWSLASGIKGAADEFSFEDNLDFEYPWGKEWPPPPDAGNYSPDLFVDNYSHTSPVGSFKPNKLGIYDLGGNVWEWCEDIFNQSPDYRILRGASWRMRLPNDLLLTNKIGNRPDLRLSVYGFRIVLTKDKKEEDALQ
ncbi:MAG: SUMF1/EgtB/PvdO family nonheme iron enzyme [Verrucomicrobiota bacterium]